MLGESGWMEDHLESRQAIKCDFIRTEEMGRFTLQAHPRSSERDRMKYRQDGARYGGAHQTYALGKKMEVPSNAA